MKIVASIHKRKKLYIMGEASFVRGFSLLYFVCDLLYSVTTILTLNSPPTISVAFITLGVGLESLLSLGIRVTIGKGIRLMVEVKVFS